MDLKLDATIAQLARITLGLSGSLTATNTPSSSRTVSRANTPTSSNQQPEPDTTTQPYVKLHSNHVAKTSPLPTTQWFDPQTLVCFGSDLDVPCEYEDEPEFVLIIKHSKRIVSICASCSHDLSQTSELYGFIAYFSLCRAAYDVVEARKEAEKAAESANT